MSKEKNPSLTFAAKKLGHAGGLKGGPARAQALSSGERSKIAAMGGRAAKSTDAGKYRETAKGKK